MWIKFIKNTESNRKGDVVTVGPDAGVDLVKTKKAIRCTGPDGLVFGDAYPEDVEAYLEQERKFHKLKKKIVV